MIFLQLFQLQSRFGNDSRFTMDKRFYESDEKENSYADDGGEAKEVSDQENIDNASASDEVQKQLEILQSIVGDKDLARKRKKQKV